MIITEFYNGQGLGNQLWNYFVLRVIAKKLNYNFGVMSKHKFKGREFMNIDYGMDVIGGYGPEGGSPLALPDTITNYYKEKLIRHPKSDLDISCADYDLFKIPDNTKIDGNMQSIKYIDEYRDDIIKEIKIPVDKNIKEYSENNICIIHIRGGDYKFTSAILFKNYYDNCMKHMLKINKDVQFLIVTDDFNMVKQMYPDIKIVGGAVFGYSDINKAIHHIGGPIWMDYSILNNAKNVIMSASSFGWWPVWTNTNNPIVIAPKYWAAHKLNDGYWSCGESLINGWSWIDNNGRLFTYDECKNELLK